MNILIVEDEFVSRTKLHKILSEIGECHVAVSGQEALEAFKKAYEEGCAYDLITVDIKLPDFDGHELVDLIRNWEIENNIQSTELEVKILMITSMSGKMVMRSFKKGCEGYIVKPFNSQAIANQLLKMGFKILG